MTCINIIRHRILNNTIKYPSLSVLANTLQNPCLHQGNKENHKYFRLRGHCGQPENILIVLRCKDVELCFCLGRIPTIWRLDMLLDICATLRTRVSPQMNGSRSVIQCLSCTNCLWRITNNCH